MEEIDIERLKTDLAYWNSVAPEGAQALIDEELFVKWDGGIERQYVAGVWQSCGDPWPLQRYKDAGVHDIVERPSPAWDGSGLPPVGVECEVIMGSRWIHCEIIGRVEGKAWVRAIKTDEHWTIRRHQSFRPLRTEKERVCELAERQAEKYGHPACSNTINALYDAGMLKETAND